MSRTGLQVRWVGQQHPPEKRKPHARQREGFQGTNRPHQYIPRPVSRQQRRISFEEAVALVARLACQALPQIEQPSPVGASALCWTLPGKAVL